jgi:hypothetical protein
VRGLGEKREARTGGSRRGGSLGKDAPRLWLGQVIVEERPVGAEHSILNWMPL